MAVSIPEKTLEQWASMYLTYRFRSKAALWWPTKGEDINVRALPRLPGKAVQLEIKTVTPQASGLQDVVIDVCQLREYLKTPCPPFYVFPWPNWRGNLGRAATAASVPVTEVAFSRSGAWWFAHWAKVLTANQVATVMAPELKALGSSKCRSMKRLLRIDPTNTVRPVWGPGPRSRPPPDLTDWRLFWNQLVKCGQEGWPQLIRLPRSELGGRRIHELADLRAKLADLARGPGGRDGKSEKGYDMTQREFDDLVTLAPDGQGSYVTISEPEGEVAEWHPDGDLRTSRRDSDSFMQNRQVVFLDARVIR